MVRLFIECQKAHQMLQNNADLKRKWTFAVEWLNDELEKRPYSGSAQYSYSSWSPPAQSNETSNGWVHACAGVCVCVCVCVNHVLAIIKITLCKFLHETIPLELFCFTILYAQRTSLHVETEKKTQKKRFPNLIQLTRDKLLCMHSYILWFVGCLRGLICHWQQAPLLLL